MDKIERLSLEEIECLKTIISTYKLPCELCIGYDDGNYRCLCNDTMCETILNDEREGRVYTISEGVLNIIIPAIRKDPECMRNLPMKYFTIIIDLAYGFTGDNWEACTDMFNLFRSVSYGVDISRGE